MRIIKKTLLALLALLLMVVGVVVFTITYRKQEVIQFILGKLNEQLNTPVKIEKVDLTFVASFPRVAIQLTNVSIQEVNSPSLPENLLTMHSVELGINAWDIINKTYRVQQIKITNGTINLKLFKNGKDNFHFWKTDTVATSNNTALFELKKLVGNHVNLKFNNYTNATALNLQVTHALLSGKFNKQTTLKLAVDGTLKSFAANDFALPNNKAINTSTELLINNTNYELNNTALSYAGIDLLINATINNATQLTYALSVTSTKSCSIKSILQLLPNKYVDKVAKYEANGTVNFNATANKKNNATPIIKASINARHASITEPSSGEKITNITIDASYDNVFNNGYINCTKLTAQLGTGSINGHCSISNFNNPWLITHFTTDVKLEAVKRIAKLDTLQQLSGNLTATIDYEGPLNLKSTADYPNIKKLQGNVLATNVVVQLMNDKRIIRSADAAMQFNNTDLVFKKLPVSINATTLNLSGELENILPYLLGSSNQLTINAVLTSNSINMDDIVNETKTTNAKTVYNIALPDNITGTIQSNIKQLKFGKLEATNINGDLILRDKKIITNGLSLSTCNGTVALKGSIDNTVHNKLNTTIDVNVKSIDVKKMFYALNNFGQTFVTDANISGILSSETTVKCTWNNALKPDIKTLVCIANTTIDKGELINFDPLKKLSRFVAVSELNNIKFSKLNNTISVKNGIITIPQMEIKSSLLDITASGTHTFDNKIDYHFSLLLNDLLAKKARNKKENTEFGEEENDGLGKIRLFISMKGTTDRPIISYDRRGLKQKLKEDFIKEKQYLKSILKQNFGLFKNDTTLKVKAKKHTEIGVDFNNKKENNSTETPIKKTVKKDKEKPKWLKKEKDKTHQNVDDFN